jgi:hypothetical protein
MAKGRVRHPKWDFRDELFDAKPVDHIDLHTLPAAEATAAVRQFLARASRFDSGKVVEIVTGKGKGSGRKPVLRPLVKTLLTGECRALVADWTLSVDEGAYQIRCAEAARGVALVSVQGTTTATAGGSTTQFVLPHPA